MVACLYLNGRSQARTSDRSDLLPSGTIRGLHALRRRLGGETVAYPSLRERHISSLVHEPRSGRLFADLNGRGADGGLFVSTDLGLTWQPHMQGLHRPHVYTEAGDPLLGGQPAAIPIGAGEKLLPKSAPWKEALRGKLQAVL